MSRTKTVFITGATSGIGLHTAIQLAQKGFRVLFTGRDVQKIEAVRRHLENIMPAGHVGYPAELTSIRAAAQVADAVTQDAKHLDVLISNAGGVYQKRVVTEEGLEATFVLNHLAPFVLIRRCIPLLEAAAPARIVVVSSHSHYSARVDWTDLQCEKKYQPLLQYANTKLMNIWFSNVLDQRLAGKGIRSNALHPGVVRTGIGYKNTNLLGRAGWWLFTRIKGIEPEAGATTSVFLATEPQGIEVGGKYFSNCREKQPSPAAQDGAQAEKLWEISEHLENKVFNKVL